MIIDFFCHIYPKQIFSIVKESRVLSFASNPYFVHPQKRLKHMEKYNVALQVLSMPLSNAIKGLSVAEEVRLCKTFNDAVFDICNKHLGKFEGIACVPLSSVGEALDEVSRAIGELGFKGILVSSNIRGKPLDSQDFYPLYEKAVKYDFPILVHPADCESYYLLKDYGLMLSIGWPFDTTQAMCRLVMGGVFHRYPTLKIVVHHLGGVLPHLVGRLQTSLLLNKPTFQSPKQILDNFKLFYADTAIDGWRSGLACGYSFFGPDRILFATDYPFGPKNGEVFIGENLKSVMELPISDEDKFKIFELNARKLLHLQ